MHKANFTEQFYRKGQVFLDTKANVGETMALNVEVLTKDQRLSEVEKIVNMISGKVDGIEADMYQSMQQLVWKNHSYQARRMRNLEH